MVSFLIHPLSHTFLYCSFLLDQLMRYEAVVVSDDDITDYSASEDESISQIEPSPTLTQVGRQVTTDWTATPICVDCICFIILPSHTKLMEPLKGTEDSNLQASPVPWLFRNKLWGGGGGSNPFLSYVVLHTIYTHS